MYLNYIRWQYISVFLVLSIHGPKQKASAFSIGDLFPISKFRHRAQAFFSKLNAFPALNSKWQKRSDKPLTRPSKWEYLQEKPLKNRINKYPEKKTKKSSRTKPKAKPFVLPAFTDVVWKFSKSFLLKKNQEIIGKPDEGQIKLLESLQTNSINSDLSENIYQDNVDSNFKVPPKLDNFNNIRNNSYINNIVDITILKNTSKPQSSFTKKSPIMELFQEYLAGDLNPFNMIKRKPVQQFLYDSIDHQNSPKLKKPIKYQPSTATNSPIFYIKLPPVDYNFRPTLNSYVSKPSKPPDLHKIFRPKIDFLNNGKPTVVYSLPSGSKSTPQPHLESSHKFSYNSQKYDSQKQNYSTKSKPISYEHYVKSSTVPYSSIISKVTKKPTSGNKDMQSANQAVENKPFTPKTPVKLPNPTTRKYKPSFPFEFLQEHILREKSTTSKPFTKFSPKLIKTSTNSPITWLDNLFLFNGNLKNIFVKKPSSDKTKYFKFLQKRYPTPKSYLYGNKIK